MATGDLPQTIVSGTPQGAGEVNVMDYYGAQAGMPVLQPETTLQTQIEDQKVKFNELQSTFGTKLDTDELEIRTSVAGSASKAYNTVSPSAYQASTSTATAGTKPTLTKTSATTVEDKVAGIDTQAATGSVSTESQVAAAQGSLSPEAMAEAQKMDEQYIKMVPENVRRQVESGELPVAALADYIPVSEAQLSYYQSQIQAEQGRVSSEELIDVERQGLQIQQAEQAAVVKGEQLSPEAKAQAAQADFSNALAEVKVGVVSDKSTVQGQLADLMKQFDDGTPAWAAGAIRSANAAMAARGLSGSSMAGAAILQAAMESAMPIAQQDAQTFAQMELTNLNNAQQVALANAAAMQGLELANMNARQQAALQNSSNSFALQAQDLSNEQQVILANAQMRAAVQEKNLDVKTQAAMVNAARVAEMNNINLANRQQAMLQRSAENLQIETANLSNRQQTALANAQIEAALKGQELDNKQQAAIVTSERYAEANNLTFNAQQQATLQNSQLMQTVGLAELNSKQAATLQNAATLAGMDMANLSNRQQAAVQNAQAFLQMDMANLSNEQQAQMFDAQSRIQAIFNDQAATNAATNINAASQNELDQFYSSLAAQTSQFNATQRNATSQFNAAAKNQMKQFAEETQTDLAKFNATQINDRAEFNASMRNSVLQFNATMENNRQQFNAENKIAIDASNVAWRRQVNTANTAAKNAAIQFDVQNTLNVQQSSLTAIRDHFDSMLSYAFQAEENDANRNNSFLIASMTEQMRKDIAADEQTGSLIEGIIGGGIKFLGSEAGSSILDKWF